MIEQQYIHDEIVMLVIRQYYLLLVLVQVQAEDEALVHLVDDELIVEIELYKDQMIIWKWKNVISELNLIGYFVMRIVHIQI
jgi:hypothetical protein